jgi:hypothetical protein
MHFALHIHEILAIILDFLYEDALGLRALVALSVSCKIFHEPALDTLWHTLPGWAPLVKCLPQDAWEVKIEDGNILVREESYISV